MKLVALRAHSLMRKAALHYQIEEGASEVNRQTPGLFKLRQDNPETRAGNTVAITTGGIETNV